MRYVLLLLMLLSAGCGRPGGRPNVLLITLDTTRADRIGCYGYTNALTPTIDALAARGVRFERAYCHTPLTLPSHATMMTGLLPPEHGLHINGEHALPEDIPTLAEAFKKKGYTTAAFIASVVLDAKYGLDRGFDVYDDDINFFEPGQEGLRAYRPGNLVTDAFLHWFADAPRKPFFSWIHYFDPHKPYHAHPELYEGHPYDAEIAFMDRQIERVVDALISHNQFDQTLIVLAGDHGEGLGDHNEAYHGNTLYQSTIHVPLIFIWSDRLQKQTTIDVSVGLERIYNTLRETALSHDSTDPLSLHSALIDRQLPKEHPVYLETDEPYRQYGWAPLRGMINGAWKYIRSPIPELYDLTVDPNEKSNLADTLEETVTTMNGQLAQTEARFQRIQAKQAAISPKEKRIFASLGYVGGASGAPYNPNDVNLPEVKKMLPILQKVRHARYILKQGQHDEAIDILRQATNENPSNMTFQFLLAESFFDTGRLQQAEEVLSHVLNQSARITSVMKIDALSLKARCLYAFGKKEEAIQHLRSALAIEPDHSISLNGLAWILATRKNGNTEDQLEALESALKAHRLRAVDDPTYLDTLAAAYAANGLFEKARHTARNALSAAEDRGQTRLAEKIKKRLTLYEQNRSYTE